MYVIIYSTLIVECCRYLTNLSVGVSSPDPQTRSRTCVILYLILRIFYFLFSFINIVKEFNKIYCLKGVIEELFDSKIPN